MSDFYSFIDSECKQVRLVSEFIKVDLAVFVFSFSFYKLRGHDVMSHVTCHCHRIMEHEKKYRRI